MESKFLSAACNIFGISPEEVMKYAKMDQFDADRMLADKWRKLSPQTEEDVIKYYTDNPEFSYFHLRFIYNMDDNYRNVEFFNKIETYIPDIRNYKILDYGCGSGGMGLTFANSGCNQVTLADIPLPLFKIVKKMFQEKRDMGDINFIDIESKYPLKEMYDFITCIDVMEHIRDPDLVLKHLVEHLNNEKYIYIETFFGGEHAPYHLVENNKFAHYDTWKAILENNKLVPVHMNDVGGLNGLYKKI